MTANRIALVFRASQRVLPSLSDSNRIAILSGFEFLARYYTLLPRCSTKCPLCSSRLPRCRDELGRLRYSYSALNDIAPGPNVRTVLPREIAPAHVSLRPRHIDVRDSFAERACRLTSGERPCVLTLVCPTCGTCATGCLSSILLDVLCAITYQPPAELIAHVSVVSLCPASARRLQLGALRTCPLSCKKKKSTRSLAMGARCRAAGCRLHPR